MTGCGMNRTESLLTQAYLQLIVKCLGHDISVRQHYKVSTELPVAARHPHVACVPSKDSDQPEHPSSLIRVFAVYMKEALVLSYPLSAQ